MSRDIHDIDDVFQSAYREFEEDPSGRVWENLNAELTEKEAEKYRRKFVNWKRISIMLFFILGGLVLYEAGILHTKADELKVTSSNKIETEDKNKKDASVIKNMQQAGSQLSMKQDGKVRKITTHKILQSNTESALVETSSIADKAQKNNPAGEAYPQKKETDAVSIPNNANVSKAAPLQPGLKQTEAADDKPNTLTTNNLLKNTDAKNKEKFKPYWSVTGFAAGDHAQYILDNDLPGNQRDEEMEIKERERHEFSFSASLLATLQLNKRIGIQTGITYSDAAISIDPETIYAMNNGNGGIGYKYVTSSGYAFIQPSFNSTPANGDSLNTESAQHHLQFISIPVIFTYSFNKGRFSFSPGVGISANFLTSAKVETEIKNASSSEKITIKKLYGLRSFYPAIIANANLQYSINDKWKLTALPSFRLALSPINKNNVVKTYPYNFGVGIGITYRLK